MDFPTNKSRLRKNILHERESISPSIWLNSSQLICDRISQFSLFDSAKTVLGYFSIRQEPNLNDLFNIPKKWGLPRCVGKNLVWHLWEKGEKLNIGKYGIKEPFSDAIIIEPQLVDLILVPAVACDSHGYRLGYGGGYYDRLLSSSNWHNIPTVGIVFDSAYFPKLPTDPWDIKLNYVCTESFIITA